MKRTVLITGCSNDSLGAALALEFQRTGHRVLATARNPSKLTQVQSAGIETLALDVQSATSINQCVAEVRKLLTSSNDNSTLDMLINNAGGLYQAPLLDVSTDEARKLFDLNVVSILSVTQGFMPLLLKSSDPVVVNHTSVASVLGMPFNAVYSASKAAAASITGGLRIELQPFGVRVVEIKSGNVKSKINDNANAKNEPVVSENSVYWPAREVIGRVLSGEMYKEAEVSADVWAKNVVKQLTGSAKLPLTIWTGANASLVFWCFTLMPTSVLEAVLASGVKITEIKKAIMGYGKEKAIENAYGKE